MQALARAKLEPTEVAEEAREVPELELPRSSRTTPSEEDNYQGSLRGKTVN